MKHRNSKKIVLDQAITTNKRNNALNDDRELITDKYTLSVADWRKVKDESNSFEISEECELVENRWLLTFRPFARDYDLEGYASVWVTNLSKNEIKASYSMRIKNNRNDDIIFTDPEGMIKFESFGSGNDQWGTDEFIQTKSLIDDLSGFIIEDSIKIELEISRYVKNRTRDTLLMKAIADSKVETDLLAIANDDILPYRLKYAVAQSEQLKQLEDTLVDTRITSIYNKSQEEENISVINHNNTILRRPTYYGLGAQDGDSNVW